MIQFNSQTTGKPQFSQVPVVWTTDKQSGSDRLAEVMLSGETGAVGTWKVTTDIWHLKECCWAAWVPVITVHITVLAHAKHFLI